MKTILDLHNIYYSYHTSHGETRALSNLSFSLAPGEFAAVVGPSGCGKSTLLSLICGLMKPQTGEILLNGESVHGNSPQIGYMLQHDHLFEWRTIYRNILLGPEISHTLNKVHAHSVWTEIFYPRKTFPAFRWNAAACSTHPHPAPRTGTSSFR